MDIKKHFSYENERYFELMAPSREVVDAAQRANRFLDTVKEWFYFDAVMPETSAFVHGIAHKYPELFDEFVDILHQRRLKGYYPATPELTEEIADVSRAFEICLACINDVSDALRLFCETARRLSLLAMEAQAQDLIEDNEEIYQKVLDVYVYYQAGVDRSAFERFISAFTQREEEDD